MGLFYTTAYVSGFLLFCVSSFTARHHRIVLPRPTFRRVHHYDNGDEQGLSLLHQTVEELARPVGGCQWTAEQNVSSVLQYLQEEMLEVREQATLVAAAVTVEEMAVANKRLLDECGDVLWNAMLLSKVASAGSGGSIDTIALGAATKLRRRTPYMAWESGILVSETGLTRDEAERLWNEAKALEVNDDRQIETRRGTQQG